MSALNDMLRLLPPGIAWTRNPLSHFFKLWSAMAPEFDRVEARARDLYDSFIFERTSERSRDFWEATNNLVPVDVLGVAVEVFGLVDEDFGPLSKANIISRGPMTEARFERWLAALPERWNVLPALAFETTAPLALTIAIDSTDFLGLNYILFSIEAWKLGNVSINFEYAPAFTAGPTVTNKTNPGNPILVGDEGVVDHTVEAVPSAAAATYQWTRDGVDIPGETTAEYTTVLADAGTELACTVTRTNARGTRVATSLGVPVT